MTQMTATTKVIFSEAIFVSLPEPVARSQGVDDGASPFAWETLRRIRGLRLLVRVAYNISVVPRGVKKGRTNGNKRHIV